MIRKIITVPGCAGSWGRHRLGQSQRANGAIVCGRITRWSASFRRVAADTSQRKRRHRLPTGPRFTPKWTMLNNICHIPHRYSITPYMEAPKCRFCGARHYAMQPHVFNNATEPRTKPVKLAAPIVKETIPQALHCPTCQCNGKRVYKSAAERQKAYRERRKL